MWKAIFVKGDTQKANLAHSALLSKLDVMYLIASFYTALLPRQEKKFWFLLMALNCKPTDKNKNDF